jgi:hypothetical protein
MLVDLNNHRERIQQLTNEIELLLNTFGKDMAPHGRPVVAAAALNALGALAAAVIIEAEVDDVVLMNFLVDCVATQAQALIADQERAATGARNN